MSALAGTWPRGAPPAAADAARLLDTIRFLGPDRQHAWADAEVALAHGAFHTTPESLRERQPLVGGALALVADARIDNRDELLGALPASLDALGLASDGLPPTDADLILAAYHRWEAGCTDHLVGDFAFAVWDRDRQRLFAARDPFGVRPFYYAADAAGVAFASEARALVATGRVPRTPDLRTLAGLLRTSVPEDLSRTVYEGVRSLPGGHQLTAERGAVVVARYHTLAPDPSVEGLSDEECVARFHDLFVEAVRCRVRSAFPVGVQLSGGLDSSAVACVARDVLADEGRLPVPTYTLTFEATPDADERAYAQSVLDQGGFAPRWVPGDEYGPLGNLDEIYDHVDDAFVIGTQQHVWAMLQAARADGVRVLLDGVDGDAVVDHGRARLFELAREGDWETFGHEVRTLGARFSTATHVSGYENDFRSPQFAFRVYGRPELDRLAAEGSIWAYAASLRRAVRHAGAQPKREVRRVWRRLLVPRVLRRRRAPDPARRWEESPISTAFAEQVPAPADVPTVARPPTVRDDQLEFLSGPKMPYLLGLGHRVSMVAGVELAHPFFDVRLVEFCLALPSSLSLRDGWIRYILRAALADTLPPLVAERSGKAAMGGTYAHGLFDLDGELLEELVHNPGWPARLVGVQAMRSQLAAGPTQPNAEVTALGTTVAFLAWMRRLWASDPLADEGAPD